MRLNLSNPQPHSDECRDRVEAALAKSEAGVERLRQSQERMAKQRKDREEEEGKQSEAKKQK
eukprot:9174668-Karenia_brevis.AAC.1